MRSAQQSSKELRAQPRESPEYQVAYLYFHFNDENKQRVHEFLSRQLLRLPESAEAAIQSGQQQPTLDALKSTFKPTLENAPLTFMILDALDECNESEKLLEAIIEIRQWEKSDVRILATSRKERVKNI